MSRLLGQSRCRGGTSKLDRSIYLRLPVVGESIQVGWVGIEGVMERRFLVEILAVLAISSGWCLGWLGRSSNATWPSVEWADGLTQ